MSNKLAYLNNIIDDLKRAIEGEVSTTEADVTAVSHDFGGMVERRPQVVVRPLSSNDVAQVVRYAVNHGLTVSSRAAGHSCSGQALNQNGILLDMRHFNQIREFRPDKRCFTADSGTTWRKIVDLSLPQNLTPPVLTNNFDVTIGGTCSAAGLGQTSFRYGSQADNCIGVEVVTASGEIVWCTPEENSELFYHVLCGYGQFGVITQIQHQLRQYRPYTRTYFLRYDDLDTLLKDQRLLAEDGRVDGLMALFSPCVLGALRAGGQGLRPLIQWFYRMQITVEIDSKDNVDEAKLLGDLSFVHHLHTEELTFEKFIQPFAELPHPKNEANPWLDIFLPAPVAKQFMEIAIERIPTFVDFRKTPVGSFCLNPKNIKMPLFPLPKTDFVSVFGMYPTIPKDHLKPVVSQLNQLTKDAFKMGAKRYMGSWLELDKEGWRHQFGDYWPKLNELRQKYDPKGIFDSGFFPYEAKEPLQKSFPGPRADEGNIQFERYVVSESPDAKSNQRVPQTSAKSLARPKSKMMSQAIAAIAVLVLLSLLLSKTSLLSQIHSLLSQINSF